MGGLLGANKREEWVTLTSDLETSTDQWLNLALKCLQLIQGRPDCVNVIVTQVLIMIVVVGIAVNSFHSDPTGGCSDQDPLIRPRSPLPR